MYWFLREGSGPETASLVSPGQGNRRRGFRMVLEVLSFLTSVIRIWEQGSLVPISSSAGGSPQELEAPINRWCWGGRGLLVGTVTCSVTQTADKRMLVILKKASSHLWSSSPPNSLSKDREERMATKGIQILPKLSNRHGSLNKDLKIEKKKPPRIPPIRRTSWAAGGHCHTFCCPV